MPTITPTNGIELFELSSNNGKVLLLIFKNTGPQGSVLQNVTATISEHADHLDDYDNSVFTFFNSPMWFNDDDTDNSVTLITDGDETSFAELKLNYIDDSDSGGDTYLEVVEADRATIGASKIIIHDVTSLAAAQIEPADQNDYTAVDLHALPIRFDPTQRVGNHYAALDITDSSSTNTSIKLSASSNTSIVADWHAAGVALNGTYSLPDQIVGMPDPDVDFVFKPIGYPVANSYLTYSPVNYSGQVGWSFSGSTLADSEHKTLGPGEEVNVTLNGSTDQGVGDQTGVITLEYDANYWDDILAVGDELSTARIYIYRRKYFNFSNPEGTSLTTTTKAFPNVERNDTDDKVISFMYETGFHNPLSGGVGLLSLADFSTVQVGGQDLFKVIGLKHAADGNFTDSPIDISAAGQHNLEALVRFSPTLWSSASAFWNRTIHLTCSYPTIGNKTLALPVTGTQTPIPASVDVDDALLNGCVVVNHTDAIGDSTSNIVDIDIINKGDVPVTISRFQFISPQTGDPTPLWNAGTAYTSGSLVQYSNGDGTFTTYKCTDSHTSTDDDDTNTGNPFSATEAWYVYSGVSRSGTRVDVPVYTPPTGTAVDEQQSLVAELGATYADLVATYEATVASGAPQYVLDGMEHSNALALLRLQDAQAAYQTMTNARTSEQTRSGSGFEYGTDWSFVVINSNTADTEPIGDSTLVSTALSTTVHPQGNPSHSTDKLTFKVGLWVNTNEHHPEVEGTYSGSLEIKFSNGDLVYSQVHFEGTLLLEELSLTDVDGTAITEVSFGSMTF
jgi:hypothetical protein